MHRTLPWGLPGQSRAEAPPLGATHLMMPPCVTARGNRPPKPSLTMLTLSEASRPETSPCLVARTPRLDHHVAQG